MRFKPNEFGERTAKHKDSDGDKLKFKACTNTLIVSATRSGAAVPAVTVAMDAAKARKLAKAILKEYGE